MRTFVRDTNSGKIRVAYLIDTISCDTAGTQKQILEIMGRLDKKQFSPFLLCLWESEWLSRNKNTVPCPYYNLRYRGFTKPNFHGVIRRLASLINEIQIDIIHTFFEDSIFVGLLGKIVSGRDTVLISSRRDLGLGKGNRPWYHSLYAIALPLINHFFDGIIANCEQVRQYVAKREKTALEKIAVIHNGIELPEKSKHEPIISSRAEEYPIICMVANLTPVKRHSLFIRALGKMVRRRPEIMFKALLLGDGPERRRLENFVGELSLESRVSFEGAVKNVAAYLRHADIGVLCSDREGLSNSIMEYMAFGLPVIATAVGGNVELVDSTNGIVFPPGDYVALADALEHLIANPELRRKLGEAGRKKIQENFSWEKTINDLQDYYLSLVKGPK